MFENVRDLKTIFKAELKRKRKKDWSKFSWIHETDQIKLTLLHNLASVNCWWRIDELFLPVAQKHQRIEPLGEKKPTSCLQGFTMEKVNLALCDKLKKLWSEDSGMDDKMTRF